MQKKAALTITRFDRRRVFFFARESRLDRSEGKEEKKKSRPAGSCDKGGAVSWLLSASTPAGRGRSKHPCDAAAYRKGCCLQSDAGRGKSRVSTDRNGSQPPPQSASDRNSRRHSLSQLGALSLLREKKKRRIYGVELQLLSLFYASL